MSDDPTDHDRGAAMLDELERLHEAAVYRSSRTWIAGKARGDGSAQVYSPSIGPLRQVVPVCETEAETAPLIATMFCSLPELIKQARLASELTALLCTEEGQDVVERAKGLQSERLILLHKRETLVGEVDSLRSALAEKDEHIKTLRRLYENTMTCHEEASNLAHARAIEIVRLRAKLSGTPHPQHEWSATRPRECTICGCSYSQPTAVCDAGRDAAAADREEP